VDKELQEKPFSIVHIASHGQFDSDVNKTFVLTFDDKLTMDHLEQTSRQAETKLLLDALGATRWNRRQAAAQLKIDYKAFLYKLQKYGIVEKAKRGEVSA